MVRISSDGVTRQDLDRWADRLPDDYLLCRDLGHVWRSYTARLTSESTYERTMQCERCRTLRHQECSASGAVLGNGYTYEPGYLAPPKTGRLTSGDRDALRLSSLLRVLDQQEHTDELVSRRNRRKGA